jgi:hypothetical protein
MRPIHLLETYYSARKVIASWNCLMSWPSRNDEVKGTPSILCGVIAMLSARSAPFSLSSFNFSEKTNEPP